MPAAFETNPYSARFRLQSRRHHANSLLRVFPPHPDTLISLGLRDLDFSTFASVLRQYGVRVVLDFRVSSSFRGPGFSMEAVSQLFEATRIQYRRLPRLADRQDDIPLNQHVRQRRYAVFLEEKKATLEELRALIRGGPAVLLGWEAGHVGSDREVLIEALQRASAEPFQLVVAP